MFVGITVAVTAGIGLTALPSTAAPTGAKAVAGIKHGVPSADTPTLAQAENDLEAAEDAVQAAESRIEKAESNVQKAKQELTETSGRQETTKTKLKRTRIALQNAEQSAKRAEADRDAAAEIRDVLRVAGTLAVDPATAAITGIDVADIIPDIDAAPGEELETAEEQAVDTQAAYISAITELCQTRRKEGTIEDRAQRIANKQVKVESRIEAAKRSRKKAQKAMKSAEAQVNEAEDVVEQARLAAERAEAAALASRSMDRPGTGGITSPYGMRTHPITGVYKLHSGTDFSYGDGIARAARAGTVASVTYSGAYGNMVTISHGTIDGDRVETRYAHLSSATVSTGQEVSAGEAVGNIGSTGYSTGAHLHFEVLINGDFVDPMTWLNR